MVEVLKTAGFGSALNDAATTKLLKAAKLNPRDCQGASPCLIKLANALGPNALVFAVDVGKIGDSLAIHVEAVTASGSIAAQDVPSDAELKAEQLSALGAFAKSVSEKLAPVTPPVVAVLPADAPKTVALEPSPAPPKLAIVSASRPSPVRRALPWVVGGAGIATLGVSGAFAALGAQDKSAFDASVSGRVSRLPGSELQTISNRGNSRFTIALTSAVVGAALVACSAALFATE